MTERVFLHTDRLVLRPLRAGDFEAYAGYYTGPRAEFVGGPISRVDAFNRFCSMIGHWQMRGFGRFAICLRGEDEGFGHAGLMQMADGALPELTWTLWTPEAEGQGYAREAGLAVRDHAFRALALPALSAIVHKSNARSARIAEALSGVADETIPTRYADERAFRFDRARLEQEGAA